MCWVGILRQSACTLQAPQKPAGHFPYTYIFDRGNQISNVLFHVCHAMFLQCRDGGRQTWQLLANPPGPEPPLSTIDFGNK